jgi:hypothetical protein
MKPVVILTPNGKKPSGTSGAKGGKVFKPIECVLDHENDDPDVQITGIFVAKPSCSSDASATPAQVRHTSLLHFHIIIYFLKTSRMYVENMICRWRRRDNECASQHWNLSHLDPRRWHRSFLLHGKLVGVVSLPNHWLKVAQLFSPRLVVKHLKRKRIGSVPFVWPRFHCPMQAFSRAHMFFIPNASMTGEAFNAKRNVPCLGALNVNMLTVFERKPVRPFSLLLGWDGMVIRFRIRHGLGVLGLQRPSLRHIGSNVHGH